MRSRLMRERIVWAAHHEHGIHHTYKIERREISFSLKIKYLFK